MVKRTLSVTIILSLMGLAGCESGSMAFNYYDDDRPQRHTYAHVDHVCTEHCHDHYWDGDRVVIIKAGHRHHPGCGHEWTSGHWVVVGSAPTTRINSPPARVTSAAHVHSRTCGCAWDRHGRAWVITQEGHVHGRNCGHIFVNGKWCLSR